MTSKLSLSFEQFRTSSNVDFHCKWKSFHHKDLHVHSDFVNVIEFSDDGSFFVSGGNDGRLLVWPENPVLDSSEDMFTKPTAMEKKQGVITSLAVDSENDCIFSGSLDDGKVFIHDARTAQFVSQVEIGQSTVWGIALEPESNGEVFSTASQDGALKLIDTRMATKNECAVELAKNPKGEFNSVTFSPINNLHVVAGGRGNGTQAFDIRHPFECLYSFSSKESTLSARFDEKGTRLVCLEVDEPLVVYDVPISFDDLHEDKGLKILLKAAGYSNKTTGKNSCCLVGGEDELVVAGSDNHGLYIWSLTDTQQPRDTEPLFILHGHRGSINSIRFCEVKSILASCGQENIIKFWTPVIEETDEDSSSDDDDSS